MTVLESDLLRTHELAAALGVSTDTVRRGIAAGRIPAIRLGERGHWLIPVDDLEAVFQPTSSAARLPSPLVTDHGRAALDADDKAAA
jgi:excisionase family DNA binding protein